MEERVKELEIRVSFLESSLVRTLEEMGKLQMIVSKQITMLGKLTDIVADDRKFLKTLSDIKV